MAEHTSTPVSTSEQWRPVVGWEGWYSVSNLGRVRRERRGGNARVGMILKPSADHKGYLRVRPTKDNFGRLTPVHRIVAAAFIGLCPNGKQINHKDCDKSNNHVENLEYVTASENKCHATRAGRHGMTKLTVANVHEIRQLLSAGMSQTIIGKRFGVGQHAISRIHTGKRWAHLT
jgi:hypothetical protein